mgnify:CR=1 FL=1
MAKKAAEKSGKSLVIVESPAKARTINKFLGRNFTVKASMGHVRDLPKRSLGVNEEDFTPTYEVLSEKRKTITELKRLGKLGEFQKACSGKPEIMWDWLAKTIPDYDGFYVRSVMATAKEIAGPDFTLD